MLQLTHDGNIDIATAKHFSDPYITKTVKWSLLLERLSQSVKTTETHLQYLNLDKKKQARIKDIGGFVGGFLNGKQRLKKNMTSRQLLTLDIDNGIVDQFEQFKEHYQCAACIYSTHSHSLETPSYRIVIPLSRPVEIDEFEAISRKICDSLGMIHFCKTSFISHHVMFWPSCCQDIDPVFEYQDGLWLDPDRILEWYEDWTDIRTWPGIEPIDFKKAFQDGRMQEDPLIKEGIIGAFCRAYTITEAIEAFLSDKYEPVEDADDRFTYTAGSTAAGLIVYEDKWAYSHHSTDPCSERLCNAFDLVRIHKFGLLDEKLKASVKPGNYPSFKAMEKWLPDEPRTKAILIREKTETLRMEFGGAEPDIEIQMPADSKVNTTWKDTLKIDKYGMPLDTRANIRIIFREDPELKDAFWFDEFGFIRQVLKKLSWHKASVPRTFQDSDRSDLRWYFQTFYGIKNAGALDDELEKVFDDHRYHPVKQYLEGLVWDGQPRLETLFIDYLGALDSVYMRTITRKSLVAAVARIFQPGIKFDYLPTFLGDQGIGKSWLLGKLGGQWFSDTLAAVHQTQKAAESMMGKWIIEIAEMSQFRKSEVQIVKAFVSSQADTFRPAYGREVITYKRQCILFPTTNDPDFIKDQTGGRRFWPIDIRYGTPKYNVFNYFTNSIRDQIWAEAVLYYRIGETLYLDKEMEKQAKIIQEVYTEWDERLDIIENYMNKPLPQDWNTWDIFRKRNYYQDELTEKGSIERTEITVHEIWCVFLKEEIQNMHNRNTQFIHQFLRKLKNWKLSEHKQRTAFGKIRTYIKSGATGATEK